jgi:hypothetical protein
LTSRGPVSFSGNALLYVIKVRYNNYRLCVFLKNAERKFLYSDTGKTRSEGDLGAEFRSYWTREATSLLIMLKTLKEV